MVFAATHRRRMLRALMEAALHRFAMMGFSVVFAQLGIPMEMMGIALAVNAIADFPGTACNVSGWQLTMIDVADSLNMLDKETLHKNN